MKLLAILCLSLLFDSCCIINSKVATIIMSGDPHFALKDSAIEFKYENISRITFSSDKEKFWPVTFKIDMPLGITRFNYFNASQFSFIYPCEQGIFIATTFEKKTAPPMDSIYFLSKSEMENLIEDEVGIRGPESVKQIKIKKNRENYLIYRNGLKVLLINIKKENSKKFNEKIYSSLILI